MWSLSHFIASIVCTSPYRATCRYSCTSNFVSILMLFMTVVVNSSAAASGTVAPAFFGMHISSVIYQPWPQVPLGTLRTWDQWPGISWRDINPTSGTYDWSVLDQVVNSAVNNSVDIVYTFGVTPAWASTNPGGTGCVYGNGSCYAPVVSTWKQFITDLTSRYRGKIKYFEIWNEPNSSDFWQGTTSQLVHMAATAYPIIHSNGGIILSPAPQGTNAHKWLDTYFAAGGYSYTDVVSFHGYLYGAPELITPLVNNIKQVVAKYDDDAAKPIWDTEHSWGSSTWPYGATQDQQAAWAARFLPLSLAAGIDRSIWYMWDGYDGKAQWGTLYNATQKQLQLPGMAYREMRNWLLDATLDSCGAYAGFNQCQITRTGGDDGLIIWAPTSDAAFNASYSVPNQYIQYRTLDAQTLMIPSDRIIPVGMKPILLEKAATGTLDTAAPSIPTGLAGTSLSPSEVNLTWSPSSDDAGVAGYQIFRSGARVASTSLTSHTDVGIAPSTTYTYTVSAYDAAGNISPQSAPISITTQAAQTAIAVGSRVRVTSLVEVRLKPTSTAKVRGTQATGSEGVVSSGPVQSGGTTWWNVNFDTGADGWVPRSGIAVVSN